MFGIKSICGLMIALLTAGLAVVTPSPSGAASMQQAVNEMEPPADRTVGEPEKRMEIDSRSPVSALRTAEAEDREELQELLAVLDEETEIATKTKMNGDYVPGMVTVLQGERLEALGIRTVAEALTLVPGIQLARVASGEPSVKIRGFAYPFNAGNVKVMLNSIALSRESSGINSSVLLTPVAQVDRIEVIRGPGSILYGDFALAGVVNIITKSEGGGLFVGGGDDESIGGGGRYAYRDEENSLGIGLNVSLVDDGESASDVKRDTDEERFTGVFHLDYGGFSLTAEGVSRKADFENLLPSPRSETDASQREESWAIEGRQTVTLGQNVDIEAYVSYLRTSRNAERPLSEFQGDRVTGGLGVNWSPWSGHEFLFGFSYTYSDIDHAVNQEGVPAQDRIGGVDRGNYSLSVQDQITLNDRLSLTVGLRFDDYDDVGELLTPRVAGVYRLAEHHVIKAQYSEGFRAPTFWELYETGDGNENLDFEVIRTVELAYIYRRPKAVGRLTFYYSKIDNGIYVNQDLSYENIADIESKGVEVEWEQQLFEQFRWLANLSYIDTWDERAGDLAGNRSLGVADWLGNLAFFVQPLPSVLVTGRLLYVGDRHAPEGWVDGYETVDLSVSGMDLAIKGLTLRAGVKDIFDKTIIYTTQRPTGLFEDEFRGRTFWMQASYDF
jgi:outer membrane receptor for ferrienterochelin and colicins